MEAIRMFLFVGILAAVVAHPSTTNREIPTTTSPKPTAMPTKFFAKGAVHPNDQDRKPVDTPLTVTAAALTRDKDQALNSFNASISSPWGLATDSSSQFLYFCDRDNSRVRQLSLSSGEMSTVAGGGHSGDGSIATEARVWAPSGLAVVVAVHEHIVYNIIYFTEISENSHRVRKISSSFSSAISSDNSDTAAAASAALPIISTVAGGDTAGYSGDGGVAGEALLNHPFAVSADKGGDVYFTDSLNNRVRKIARSMSAPTAEGVDVAGGGFEGGVSSKDFISTVVELDKPYALAVHSSSKTLFVADSNNKIHKISLVSGAVSTFANLEGMGQLTSSWTNFVFSMSVDFEDDINYDDIFRSPFAMSTAIDRPSLRGSNDGRKQNDNKALSISIDGSIGMIYISRIAGTPARVRQGL